MKLLIDADGCPVISQAASVARSHNTDIVILCDTSHIITCDGAEILTVSKGADSVDFALVNKVSAGDIVVTQDYGLAAMVLAKKGIPITQNGLIISEDNISMLLAFRYQAKKARRAGKHTKGPKKRTEENDRDFILSLTLLFEKCSDS